MMKNIIIMLLVASTAFLAVLSYERNREYFFCLALSQPGVSAVASDGGFMDDLADVLQEAFR